MRTSKPALALAIVVLATVSAHAQQARPPFRGLFSASDERPVRGQSAVIAWSIETANDRDGRTGSAAPAEFTRSRTFTDAVGELRYNRAAHAFSLTARAGAALRRDAAGGSASLFKDQASLAIAISPARRWAWRASAGLMRSPYSLLPVEGPTSIESGQLTSATDHFLTSERTVTTEASGGLTRRLTRTLTVSADYAARMSRLSTAPSELRAQRASVRAEQQWGHAVTVTGGYSAQLGSFTGTSSRVLDSREADLGFNYRPTATSRHRISFGAGSARVNDGDRIRQRATGYGRFERAFGRAWISSAEYRRGVDVLPGIARPLMADSIVASIGGYFGRRTDLVVFAGLWSDVAAAGGDTSVLRSRRFGGRARFALNRLFAVYGEYLRFDYQFNSVSDVPTALAADDRRQGIRLGLMSRLPFGR